MGGSPMATILPFIRPEMAFDEYATSAMGQAFDAACAELQENKLPNLVREIIAERIIEAAKRGERDPKRLCDVGVAAIRPDGETELGRSSSRNQSQRTALSE
jgi:hypothetical protein